MSDFERVYQIDPSREAHHPREKHPSIELSDREYLQTRVSKEMEQEGWVYREPPPEESMSPALKEKFKKARKICQDTKVIDLTAEPPPIPMNLEMPELEKAIKEGKKNERKKNKAPTKRTKKANPKSNEPAMADVQTEL